MKIRAQLTLDNRELGKPVELEIFDRPGYQAWMHEPFGELANELKDRSRAMWGDNHFPLEQTFVGVRLEVIE